MQQSTSQMHSGRRIAPNLPAWVALATLVASLPAPAAADDRDLFRAESSTPYIMVLFDATGSMADNLAGNDTALEDDDSDSKLYLAKQALDQVLQDVEGVNFGFATFPDQDRHYVDFKSFNPTAYVTNRNGSNRDVNCSGWEPNNDRWQDRSEGYSYMWPNSTNARGLKVGDIVPLDWGDNNVERIRQRLAPNLALGQSPPDFGIARYFRDRDTSGTDYRALRNGNARPFIAAGLTPLAGALNSFRDWYDDWKELAEEQDPAFTLGCRQVFVLLMTDGFETCNGNAVTAATNLLGDGVQTYVVGFAVNNPALDNIAVAGGTEAAYVAANQDELVEAFNQILVDVQVRSRTFASAAVPSVVGSASNSLFLTSFGPVADSSSMWPGRVDAWVRPVQTTSVDGQQVPDRNRRCSDTLERGCLAWDAGEEILAQAPTQSQVDSSDFRIGMGADQRRVYWSRSQEDEQVPLVRELFLPPDDYDLQKDFYGPGGMGIDLPKDETDKVQVAQFAADGNDVIKETLKIKNASVADPLDPSSLISKDFVLGDIFHSDPTILREPQRSDYFARDLAGALEPCDPDEFDAARYPCFVRQHLFRRRVLFAGSNDGQLHAFEAGLPRRDDDSGLVEYDFGSGGELFAFVPRAVLPDVREMAEGEGQDFTVDGPVTIDDALVDPILDAMDTPNPAEREWRTILVGGLREGGSAYYALDVTQPDPLLLDDTDDDGNVTALGLPDHGDSLVPKCADPGQSGCGPLPYPAVRWSFTDTWDEDGNGAPDLGDTWSRANTGRIKVDVDGVVEDRYVAIFGGGLDPDFEQQPLDEADNYRPTSGNYLYMVDIETGKAIYKRRVDVFQGESLCASLASGSCLEPGYAASEPAAIDADRDSYLDTIYIGTSAGYLMKVDISEPAPLVDTTVDDHLVLDAAGEPTERDVTRVVDSRWDPIPLFSTGGRPIFYPPSVVFYSATAEFALAFGTGDRFDITREDPEEGRFYVFLDAGIDGTDPNLPYQQNALQAVVRSPGGGGDATADFFAQDPGPQNLPGWVLQLEPNERLLNRSFSLAGLLTFSTFIPEPLLGGSDSCASTGRSRLYAAFVTNGSPLHGDDMVLEEVQDFVTQPFVSSGDSADDMASDQYQDPDSGNQGAAGCDADLAQSVRTAIMQFFPDQCAFTNFSLDVKVLLSQNGMQCVVPIPVCVIERNWKEF